MTQAAFFWLFFFLFPFSLSLNRVSLVFDWFMRGKLLSELSTNVGLSVCLLPFSGQGSLELGL